MASTQALKDDEERQISRGGKATGIWIVAIALFMTAFGVLTAHLIRERVSPPARPGTTPGITRSGSEQPPSPEP